MLTCEIPNGVGTSTIVLKGFSFKVSAQYNHGAPAQRLGPTNYELTVRFVPGSSYQLLLRMALTGDHMRSCRLVDGEGSGGITTAPGGTIYPRTGNPSTVSSASPEGALTWTLTDAIVTSVTLIGNEMPTGAMEGQIQATLSAERYDFSM
jgi:hypothetical protein